MNSDLGNLTKTQDLNTPTTNPKSLDEKFLLNKCRLKIL